MRLKRKKTAKPIPHEDIGDPNQKGFACEEEQLQETLPPHASAPTIIHDFVHSDNSKFSGDSKKQRIKRALGAYYKRKREGK